MPVLANVLPLPATPFIGRAEALAEIYARLSNPECRLLIITGGGGSGKTRLALEAAQAMADHFPQRSVFVGLQTLSKSDLLVPTIARAIGLTFYGADDPQTQLFDYLREKSSLLVFDNFEHLLDGAELVSAILHHAPGIKVLITSREALNLQEEWLYPLKGMTTPPSVYAHPLEDYEAVQLFLYHAHRMQPNFDLIGEHEAIIRICEMTAGLPLAIEIAAAWLKGLSATQIASEMQRNLDFLATNTRNVEARHRSMRAVFDQSWKLLTEDERLIFAKLSIFPGGFDSDAADQVAGAWFSCLSALVEKSLIQKESSDRYGIHEMLRQYGMEKLEAYGQTEATYAHFSQYFAQRMLQHEAGLKQPQQLQTMQTIEDDFENIRLAWEWSDQHNQVDNLHAMLNGLYLFGFLGNRYRESITIFQQTLDHSVEDTALLGRLLARRWGYMHWWYQPDYQEAFAGIEQAVALAEAGTDRFEIAFAHLMMAYVLINTKRYVEALPHLHTSKSLFEAINEPYYVCWVLHRLGYVYSSMNDSEKYFAYTEQSLALARVTHNRVALFICLYNLGTDYVFLGDYLKASVTAVESLQVATENDHQEQIAHALSLLAFCTFCQGDYDACRDYAARARATIENISATVFESYALAFVILLACLREDYTEALRLSELSKPYGTSRTDFQLHYWALAALACGQGNRAEVRMVIPTLLELADAETISAVTAWMFAFAAYALAETDPEKAVELLAWIRSNPDSALNWIRDWALFDRLQNQLQAALSVTSYQAHWEQGKALSFDAIKAYLYREFPVSPIAGASADEAAALLTVREHEILRLMAAGMTNPQIAAHLVIGAGTVKSHTLSIYRKLDVANRTQAILRAQVLGLA